MLGQTGVIGAGAPIASQNKGHTWATWLHSILHRQPTACCSLGFLSPGISKADSQALQQLPLTENHTKPWVNHEASLKTAAIHMCHEQESEGHTGAGRCSSAGDLHQYWCDSTAHEHGSAIRLHSPLWRSVSFTHTEVPYYGTWKLDKHNYEAWRTHISWLFLQLSEQLHCSAFNDLHMYLQLYSC